MSILAGALPRLAAAILQPPVLAAGLVTGVVGGSIGVGTGVIPVTDAGPRLTSLYECPGSAVRVTSVARDQKVLVTARSADGAWLEIYVGEPGVDRGWARATSVELPSPADGLPVVDCTPSSTLPPGSDPGAVPSATTATVTPDGPPTVTNLIVGYPSVRDPATGTHVIGTPSRPCNGETAALITVQVSDPDGVAYVGLGWDVIDRGTFDADMEDKGGDLWEAWIEAEDNWAAGTIEYFVFARDTKGDFLRVEWDPSQELELRRSC